MRGMHRAQQPIPQCGRPASENGKWQMANGVCSVTPEIWVGDEVRRGFRGVPRSSVTHEIRAGDEDFDGLQYREQ